MLLALIAIVIAVIINVLGIRAAGMVNNVGATRELVGTIGFTVALAVGLFFFHHVQGPHVLSQTGSSNGSPASFSTIGLAPLLPVYVVAFIAMLSALLANITVATRTSFSLARDDMLPFPRVWSTVNPRTATPISTILAVGVFATGVNLLSGGLVANVLSVVNIALYLTYGSTCVAVLIAHRRGSIPEAPARYFSLGRALVPVTLACLTFCVAVIVSTVGPASSQAILLYALYFEGAGVIWYLAAVRPRLVPGAPQGSSRGSESGPLAGRGYAGAANPGNPPENVMYVTA